MKCRTCRYLSDIDGLCSLNVDGTCVAPYYLLWEAKPIPAQEQAEAYKLGLAEGAKQIATLAAKYAASQQALVVATKELEKHRRSNLCHGCWECLRDKCMLDECKYDAMGIDDAEKSQTEENDLRWAIEVPGKEGA